MTTAAAEKTRQDVNKQLREFIRAGDYDAMMNLLDVEKIDINKANRTGLTPLMCTCMVEAGMPTVLESDRMRIARELIRRGAEVEVLDDRGRSPVFLAYEHNLHHLAFVLSKGREKSIVVENESHKPGFESYLRACENDDTKTQPTQLSNAATG